MNNIETLIIPVNFQEEKTIESYQNFITNNCI